MPSDRRFDRPPKRYYLTFARGENIRCVRVPRAALAAVAGGGLVLLGFGAVGLASLFQNPDAKALQARQAEIEASYEDRLAALRTQMDIAKQVEARERTAVDAKIQNLALRQQRLDSRAQVIGRLAESSIPMSSRAADISGPAGAPAFGLPPESSDLGPIQALAPARAEPQAAKPRPDAVELRPGHQKTSSLDAHDSGRPPLLELASLQAQAARVQAEQLAAITAMAAEAKRRAGKIRSALAAAGISQSQIVAANRGPMAGKPMGGPYVPVRLDVEGSPIETQFDRLQNDIVENERIAAALPHLPLRHPLEVRLETTSPFGMRLDPFLGRLAMHPGADFRAPVGAPVLATATGKVTIASYDGGYGNLVEIDHGAGLSTRYGHLSAIMVRVGQKVSAGQTIGRVGATGRATGPHLHYEVRIDGQPVDPTKLVRAGDSVIASR